MTCTDLCTDLLPPQAPLQIETMAMTERGMTLDVAVTTSQAGFPGASEKFCTLALSSWRPQWSEAFACVHFLDIEVIFAIDIDMGIPGGPDMGQITVLHRIAFLL